MKKSRWVLGLLIVIILTIIVFLNDVFIIKFIESIRTTYLDYVFLSVTFISNTFIIFFFLTTLFLWKEHKRRWIFPLWLTSFFTIAIAFFIKILIKRPRPFHSGIVSVLQIAFHFMKDNFNTWNFSFPSFQTMLVFSALPILDREFPKFKYIWFIFASLVGFSRLYFGLHYMSDIVAGAIIGYLIGLSFIFIEKRYNLGERVIKKIKNKKNNL